MDLSRRFSRRLPVRLAVALLLVPACRTGAPIAFAPAASEYTPTPRELALADTVEERTFRWFWETTDTVTGLAHDRWPRTEFSSVASIGFALTAYPIGVERRWISRAQAAQRTLTTLRHLWALPQGPDQQDMAGYQADAVSEAARGAIRWSYYGWPIAMLALQIVCVWFWPMDGMHERIRSDIAARAA